MIRLGIVVPRYGQDVLGGAETYARQLAVHLPIAEFQVTVLTTCARDLGTWRNEYPAGESRLDAIRVLRFPVDHRRRNARLSQCLTDRFNRGEPATPEDQAAWLENSAHSPELYRHLARFGADYDLLLFLPYLFGTTIYGSAVWPGKSVICPCLHDEPYAYFTDVRLALHAVRGVMFISAPEQALAEEKLGVRHPSAHLVGFGLDEFPADGERFRAKFGIEGPFLLYAGRLVPSKNISQLINYFLSYCSRRSHRHLRLVLAGSGPFPLPDHPDLIPLGYLSQQDVHDAYAAATILCQPSFLESFSIVLMEAWLAATPVLVHGDCPVTRDHVLRSNGGLYYSSTAEFAEVLDWLLEHPEERRQMGVLGRAYVRREFNWQSVLGRFRRALSLWLPTISL